MSTKPNQKTNLESNQKGQSDQANLDRRYGEIGIASVAAALQFWTTSKKQTNTVVRIDERFIEVPA